MAQKDGDYFNIINKKMRHIILTLALIISTLLNSCAQINTNDLPGTWQVVSFTANTPSISPLLIKDVETEALSTVYTFENNNTFSMKSNYMSNGYKGVWEFSSEKKTLTLVSKTEGEQKPEIYTVELLDGGSMKWTQNIPQIGTLTLVLKKE